ncbi:uncharacterized protein LOC141821318 [Curcuma longa]|uniref:uncharacterized protein LOC141821318 n=1 Tax=Curcuma longa TaxID=136217 RepID=UPI003D9E7936
MEGNFGPAEQLLWPLSVFSGVLMCKVVYQVTHKVSMLYLKGYNNLTKLEKIEWNSRGVSTFHAVIVAAASLYLLVFSDLFKNGSKSELVVNRKSLLSDATLGISLGYFLSDLAKILWHFPSLGGKEFVLHHGLSMHSIFLSLISGKAHIYILMVLFSEATTPFVNFRWYLEKSGKKGSNLYIHNGMALFFGWLVARIFLFIYMFLHMYLHFDQVKTIFPLGLYSLLTIGPAMALLNLFWFLKILKGMVKTLSRRRHVQ